MVSQAERRSRTIEAVIAAAIQRFGTHGFAATTIDEIASDAGVAKGAVYHHFESKEAIFERVLESCQVELQTKVAAAAGDAARAGAGRVDVMKRGTRAYLTAAIQPRARQILLIDGPAVLGWEKWRAIDTRYFGASLSGGGPSGTSLDGEPQFAPRVHLLLGAITEAAMVCARARNRRAALEGMMSALDELFDALHSRV